MEDEVPGLWQTKIRNVDTKWNQTKSGDLGPAAQFYATIPKGVIGLGAGAYGETGRGIQEHHELIANHASTIMDSAVSSTTPYYEHNARSGGTPAAPREKDLVWRLVAGGVG